MTMNRYDLSKVDRINNEYFDWIYNIVCNDRYYNNLSYRKLLMFLHKQEFIYKIKKDRNRAIDGIMFRYKFGHNTGYTNEEIKEYLDTRHCSVLEMMVALAFRIEEQIMDDIEEGNRTGQWFWTMVVNLGLGNMTDSKFNKEYCEFVIDKFLNREYTQNGKGGLFSIEDDRDMRATEIWDQAMWYLNYFLDS